MDHGFWTTKWAGENQVRKPTMDRGPRKEEFVGSRSFRR
jgi:hypothetical protein